MISVVTLLDDCPALTLIINKAIINAKTAIKQIGLTAAKSVSTFVAANTIVDKPI